MKAVVRALVVAAVALVIGVGGGASALAQSAGQDKPQPPATGTSQKPAKQGTYSGVVKGRSANGFTLASKGTGDVPFSVSSNTKVQAPGISKATIEDIADGGRVTVLAVDSGDKKVALQVRLTPEELAGVVKSINAEAGTFILTTKGKGDATIQVQAATKYSLPGKKIPGFADIGTGARVSVMVSVLSRGNLALQVRLVPIQLMGKVTGVDAAGKTFTMTRGQGQVAIMVSGDTSLKSAANKDAALADIRAGARAAVTGVEGAGGVVALNVRLLPVELNGKVKSVDGASKSFVLAGRASDVAVVTNAESKYALAGNAAGSFSDIQAGDRVTVTASETAGGALALHVRFLPMELNGTIKVVSAGTKSLVLTSKEAGDVTLAVNDKTRYQAPGGKDWTFADLKAGSRVGVQAVRSAAGNLATNVRLAPVDITGKIGSTNAGAGTFVLTTRNGDVTVIVDAATRVLVPSSKGGNLGDLKVGNLVSVKAIETAGGDRALQVQLLPVDISGKVKSVDAAGKTFVITPRSGGDINLAVDANTKYWTPANKGGGFDDIKVGGAVDVRAVQTTQGNSALLVRVLPVELAGQIKSVDAASGTLVLTTRNQGDVTINVAGTTKIKTAGGANGSLGDLKAGGMAAVTAVQSSDGTVALQVRLLPTPKAKPAPSAAVRK